MLMGTKGSLGIMAAKALGTQAVKTGFALEV